MVLPYVVQLNGKFLPSVALLVTSDCKSFTKGHKHDKVYLMPTSMVSHKYFGVIRINVFQIQRGDNPRLKFVLILLKSSFSKASKRMNEFCV